MSSWSVPSRLAPFSLSTPITLNGTFLTRISSPIGIAVAEQFADERLADQADLAAAEHFAVGEDRPKSSSVQLRIFRKAAVLPVR